MNKDSYLEVINGKKTYKIIARQLKNGFGVLIGWTDENMTHFDILFTYKKIHHELGNSIQGGINWHTDLFVSIMRFGAFAFEVNDTDIHWGYYQEKLGNFGETTGRKVAELINGVKKELNKNV